MKLVSRLALNAEYGVVVYEPDVWDHGINLPMNPCAVNLLPTTSANKTRFFEWMKPINLILKKWELNLSQ